MGKERARRDRQRPILRPRWIGQIGVYSCSIKARDCAEWQLRFVFLWNIQGSTDRTTRSRMPSSKLTLRNEVIDNLIRDVREQKVILDADLARIYGVTTKRLNEQVKRNRERFPATSPFNSRPKRVRL